MLTKEQRDFFLSHAFNAALRAGAEVLKIYNNGEDLEINVNNDLKPITIADRRSHARIKESLDITRIPILSEEGRDLLYEERRGWDLFWLVDPLDGTREFIKGNGEFTVNIALIYENKPVIGIIYVPYTRKIYFCDDQIGSFRKKEVEPDSSAEFSIEEIFDNAERLPIITEAPHSIRIAISRSHNTPETYAEVERLQAKHPNSVVIEHGSSYKFCMLAEGNVDYYVRTSNTFEWDTAAGELILACAGGSTRTLNHPESSTLAYNKVNLINPHFICLSKYITETM